MDSYEWDYKKQEAIKDKPIYVRRYLKGFSVNGEKKLLQLCNQLNMTYCKDTEYFHPIERKKEFEILFNGNMNYPPNEESVEFLVKKILPLVKEKKKDARLLISGASPSQKVWALRSDSVVISGWVDDVRENFSKSKMLVAPMQISIGLQNKLIQAMAMEIPCITSALSNNAIGAKDGEEILIAGTPQEYADKIIFLLDNEEKAKEIAKKAYDFAGQKFNWTLSASLLEKLFQ